MSENITLVELIKQAVSEYEVRTNGCNLKDTLNQSWLSGDTEEILTETATIAVEVMENNAPSHQFRIPLPRDEGIATVKQNEEGKFYIWVISDRFTDGGYQVYSSFNSFNDTVLFIINELIPTLEADRKDDLSIEQRIELQNRANAKILRNSLVGNFKIMNSFKKGSDDV